MTLSLIVMRLARNPGAKVADGDDHRGYAITAPLTAEGKLDATELHKHPEACTVRRFAPNEDPEEGRLVHRDGRWFFDYGDEGDGEEPLDRLGDRTFRVGDYVSVTDADGLLTYKVTESRAA